MDKDDLQELLKKHYATRALTDAQVENILATCEIARGAHQWKQRAIGAVALAAAALVALGISVFTLLPQNIPPPGNVSAPPVTSAEERQKLIAVMIHANECPNSKAMVPVFAGLQEEFIEEPVLFLKFDHSSECAVHQAELLSKNLGLEAIFQDYRKTGAIVLASPNGVVKDVVDPEVSMAAAAATLRNNLGLSRF